MGNGEGPAPLTPLKGMILMGKNPKVFIDGKGGVVGARLYEQLSRRSDLDF